MKLKILSSLFLAAIAFVNSYAFAAVTYDDSNDDAGYAQTGDAEVVQGASARANDIIITYADGTTADISSATEIIIRLPDGLNFASTPKYKVEPSTSSLGLTLKDDAGDPTISSPKVIMTDTNGDGGMDRAVVETSTAAALTTTGYNGDTLTISVNVTADSDATVGLKQVTIIQEGKPGNEVDLVNVIKTAPT